MKNWKDIQESLQNAKEPLSETAWENMSALIDENKPASRKGLWFGVFFTGLLLLAGGYFYFVNSGEREYYNPRKQDNTNINEATNSFEKLIVDDEGKVSKQQEAATEKPVVIKSESTADKGREQEAFKFAAAKAKPDTSERLQRMETTAERELSHKMLPKLNITPSVSSLKTQKEPFIEKTDDAENTVSGFEVRFYMAPTYNIPSFSYNVSETRKHQSFAQATQNAMKPGWGIDAGFELRYRLTQNLLISSGFSYREIITQNNYDFEVNEIPVIDSATGNILAYIPTGQPEQRIEKSNNIYGFITIPVSLYAEKNLSERFIITGEAIHHTSILLNQSSFRLNPTTLEIQPQQEDLLNKTINGYQLRLGIRYKVQPGFYLALEPSYRAYYQDFFNDPDMSWKPKDFSISLSAIVKLNKNNP